MKTYLVGGAVRDQLLGLEVKERDYVVVGSDPQTLLEQGFKPVGKDFPVFLHPETKDEYALARTERKVAAGYHGFTFNTSKQVTLEDDLRRRDITINAIAQDEDGRLIDPFGGQQDLKAKIIRHVSPSFVEDPVRVLRVARFAARFAHLGFTVAPETIALIKDIVQAQELAHLVPERVWKELEKALKTESPWVFLQVLRAGTALRAVLPEIDALYEVAPERHFTVAFCSVAQEPGVHTEVDAGIHLEMAMQKAAELTTDPEVRFAVLLHDVGKAVTPSALLSAHPEHDVRGEPIVKALCDRLRVPKTYKTLAQTVTRYHLALSSAETGSADTILDLFEKCDAFRRPARFAQMLLACQADWQGRMGYAQKAFLAAPILKKALQAAARIDTQAVIQNCADPQNIKQQLHRARLQAIKASLAE